MPDPISFAALERRNRARARAQAIWDAAIALYAGRAGVLTVFASCVQVAEREYDALFERCIAAEPPTDDNEFAFRGEPMKPE